MNFLSVYAVWIQQSENLNRTKKRAYSITWTLAAVPKNYNALLGTTVVIQAIKGATKAGEHEVHHTPYHKRAESKPRHDYLIPWKGTS